MRNAIVFKAAQVRRCGSRLLLVGMLGAVAAPLVGCKGGEPRTPDNATLSEEATDMEVILHMIRAAGMTPAKGRDVQLTTGKSIHVDVSVAGREFGIAYIDKSDVAALGDAIPPYKLDPQKRLRIVSGGADGQTRILLLYYQKYDPSLTQGEKDRVINSIGEGGVIVVSTAIAASNLEDARRTRTREELSGDVQRFLDYAQVKRFR